MRITGAAASSTAVVVVALAALAIAPPASASTMGWVYISTPTWLGNCADGRDGKVDGLFATVGDTWSTNGADLGDDMVYAKVRLGEYQPVSFQVRCSRSAESWQAGVGLSIAPTRSGQTVRVAPGVVRY